MARPLLALALLACALAAASASYTSNRCLSFDGVNDIVDMSHTYQDDELTDSWTLEAWIKLEGEATIFQPNVIGFPKRHPNLEVCGDSSNCPSPFSILTQLREEDGEYITIVSEPLLSDFEWHHIAGSWNNKTLFLAIDGNVVKSLDVYTDSTIQYKDDYKCKGDRCEDGLMVGGYRCCQNVNGQYFRGYIDEVRVWKIGVSPEEIKRNKDTTLTGSEPGLLYYWRFDEGQGTLVTSLAADNYGTLGGGFRESEPHWASSKCAPLAYVEPVKSANDQSQQIVLDYSGAVTTGFFLGLLFLALGVLLGWFGNKKWGSRASTATKGWELEGLLDDEPAPSSNASDDL